MKPHACAVVSVTPATARWLVVVQLARGDHQAKFFVVQCTVRVQTPGICHFGNHFFRYWIPRPKSAKSIGFQRLHLHSSRCCNLREPCGRTAQPTSLGGLLHAAKNHFFILFGFIPFFTFLDLFHGSSWFFIFVVGDRRQLGIILVAQRFFPLTPPSTWRFYFPFLDFIVHRVRLTPGVAG